MPDDNNTDAVPPSPDGIANDIQALHDQFTPTARTWFMEQLRRGARGEPTFLDDPDQHGFEAWIRQPAPVVEAPPARPSTIDVEDTINEAQHRLHAVRLAVNGLSIEEDRAALCYPIDDIGSLLDDASSTLLMRREGGAA